MVSPLKNIPAGSIDNGFMWIESLFLTLNVTQPVIVQIHVIRSTDATEGLTIDGVSVRPVHKAICNSTVTGEYKGFVPDFFKIETMIDSVDNKDTKWYISYCRSCLVQASFLTGVASD